MAVSLKHTTQAAGTDAGNGEIRKLQWNEEHTLTLATGKLLGRSTAGTGAAEEITPSTGIALSGGNLSLDINGLTGTTPALDDVVPLYDTSAAAVRDAAASEIAALAMGGVGYRANDYYLGIGFVAAAGTIAITANRIYYIPFAVVTKATFTRIGLEVTTGVASSTARLGIYNMDGGIPTTRVLDAGTVSTASIAAVEATISQTLNPGYYCLAMICSSAPTLRTATGLTTFQFVFGGSAPSAASTNYSGFYEAGSGTTLPSSAGTLTKVTQATATPALWMRVV